MYSKYYVYWHERINAVFFIKNGHRFEDYPEYGRLVERFNNGTILEWDVELISRFLLNDGGENSKTRNFEKENVVDMYYLCSSNTEINSLAT